MNKTSTRKKRILMILAALVVLLVALAVTVQVILSTDLPRKTILKYARENLEVKIQIKKVNISWTGKTRLENITLALPDSKEYFFTAPALEISHSSLLKMLFTRKLQLDWISLDQGEYLIRKDHQGTWNLQYLINIIQEHLDRTPYDTSGNTIFNWPRVHAQDLAICYFDNVRKKQTLGKVTLTSKYGRAGICNFNLDVPEYFSAQGKINKTLISFDSLHAQILNGTIDGTGRLVVNEKVTADFNFDFTNLDLSKTADLGFALDDFTGLASGNFQVAHAQNDKPLEPYAWKLNAHIQNGSYRKAKIDSVSLAGFLGPQRFIMNEGKLQILDGAVGIRTTLTRRPQEWTGQSSLQLDKIDLNQLVHILDPHAQPLIARTSGQIDLVLSQQLSRISGIAQLNLIDSDLASNPAISAVYNTLKLDFSKKSVTGKGKINLRLEGKNILVPSFTYFNRGIDIRGKGQLTDFYLGPKSQISGFVIGTSRPLKDSFLPGAAELEKLLDSIQKTIASVRLDGTLELPRTAIVPFPQIRSQVRSLLLSESQKTNN